MGIKNQEAIMGLRQKLDLTTSEFLFLMYIAFRGNDEKRPHKDFNKARHRGEAWPSWKTINQDLGIHEKNIGKIARRLEELGILDVVPNFRDRSSCTYIINFEKVEELMGSNSLPKEVVEDYPRGSDLLPQGVVVGGELGSNPLPELELELELERKINMNSSNPPSKPQT